MATPTKVKVFQLLNGEVIIGEEILNDKAPNHLLKNPCVIMMIPDPQQPERVGVQLRPLCPFTAEKTIGINFSAVIYAVEPVQELTNQYNTLFGSGIVIAGPGALPADGRPNLTRVK